MSRTIYKYNNPQIVLTWQSPSAPVLKDKFMSLNDLGWSTGGATKAFTVTLEALRHQVSIQRKGDFRVYIK